MTDTVFARITGAGRAAVAVLRISGPQADAITRALAGSLPEPRVASVRTLRAASGEALDQALVLWTPGPASFTGEDSAELSVHGGPAVIDAITGVLMQHGARPAEPGEFSRRAFTNGKLDLLQAEAVADLVDAESETQRRQALGQLQGRTSRLYDGWRIRLVEALALIEAEIDFPDEDLPGAVAQRAKPLLEALDLELSAALGDASRGQRIRSGYTIALIGAPNAGKSSLFNGLLGRDAAIVSARPGTTRDVVEARMVVEGFAVTLADTAGVRSSGDEIEAEGVRRAQATAHRADLRLLVLDPAEHQAREGLLPAGRPRDVLVVSKADVTPGPTELEDWGAGRGFVLTRASVASPAGLHELQAAIAERVLADLGAAEQPAVTRSRHEEALRRSIAAIRAAKAVLAAAPDRAAEDLRRAALALRSVVGHVDREAVLDHVFSTFCIGK